MSKSPAFSFNEADGFVSYSRKFKTINIEQKRKDWGEKCHSLDDVSKVFTNYLSGQIKKFPFSEGSLALETADISEMLVLMN